MRTVIVTGAAGFIGSYVAARLLDQGERVVGLDSLNEYYDVSLKRARLARLEGRDAFRFEQVDVTDQPALREVFSRERPRRMIHLAAQAGVRYSLTHPETYIQSNLVGFGNVLECCRHHEVDHLVYASSSSVYGANTHKPFSEHQPVEHPLSLYGATKKANEVMAHSYSHLYGLPTTGLRFFTVYGPWGRPDMALFLFTRAILEGEPIQVFNHGRMRRDFTYIDDITEGVVRIADRIPEGTPNWDSTRPDPATSHAPYRIYNIGNHNPVELMHMIEVLERCLGRDAQKDMQPMQPGDMPETYADVDDLARDAGFHPSTPIETGIERFVAWYRQYYQV